MLRSHRADSFAFLRRIHLYLGCYRLSYACGWKDVISVEYTLAFNRTGDELVSVGQIIKTRKPGLIEEATGLV